MDDLLKSLNEETLLGLAGMLVGVIALLCGMTVGITAVVASHRRRAQRDEMEATLKMEMIQRGMAADEIAKVLEAQMGGDTGRMVANFVAGFQPRRMRGFGRACEKT